MRLFVPTLAFFTLFALPAFASDSAALMATSDICVFPSRNDAFGAVIIEAWAAKKPNISCKSPGPRAIIKDNYDGLLVEIDDVAQLAEAINKVINNNKLGKLLAKNGYAKFVERYSEQAFTSNIKRIYNSIIKLKKNKICNKKNKIFLS